MEQYGRYEEDTIRLMIHRENEYINQRISWLTTIEGLLFTAVGLSWGKPNANSFIWILAILGIIVSLIVFKVLSGATSAMKKFEQLWEKKKPNDYDGPGVIGLESSKLKIFSYVGPWNVFPIIFIVAWALIFLNRFLCWLTTACS